MALCTICGLREATGYLIVADGAEIPESTPPELALDLQAVTRTPEPNTCEPCLLARIPAELQTFLEAEARERDDRLTDLPTGAPSTPTPNDEC